MSSTCCSSYLDSVSERSMEELADTTLLAKWLIELTVDRPPPDHSPLTVFRRRMERAQRQSALEGLFDSTIGVAKDQAVASAELQVLESVHTRRHGHENERKHHDDGRPPRDPDARVVSKLRSRAQARSLPISPQPPAKTRDKGGSKGGPSP